MGEREGKIAERKGKNGSERAEETGGAAPPLPQYLPVFLLAPVSPRCALSEFFYSSTVREGTVRSPLISRTFLDVLIQDF